MLTAFLPKNFLPRGVSMPNTHAPVVRCPVVPRVMPRVATSPAHMQTGPNRLGRPSVLSADRAGSAGASLDKEESRMQLPQYDLLVFSLVAEQKSLARSATATLNPRLATSSDELSAHFEAERFKLIVVECDPDSNELAQITINVHRRIPPEDGSSLIAFKAGPDSVLDLLRYTPSASAFAFLAVQPHKLRAHILELLTP